MCNSTLSDMNNFMLVIVKYFVLNEVKKVLKIVLDIFEKCVNVNEKGYFRLYKCKS